jgi:hypothetical protein
MYIPACPVTEANAKYVQRQKQDFLAGVPPPDFPGDKGEREHHGRTTEAELREWADEQGLRSFGFAGWDAQRENLNQGQRSVLEKANQILDL